MSGLATTRLSSRGQIVIPEKIRTALRLEPPPLDPLWHTSTGIALLGPRHFGFDLDHVPLQFAERPAA